MVVVLLAYATSASEQKYHRNPLYGLFDFAGGKLSPIL